MKTLEVIETAARKPSKAVIARALKNFPALPEAEFLKIWNWFSGVFSGDEGKFWLTVGKKLPQRKLNKVVYRGLTFKPTELLRILNGQSIRKKTVESWTTTEEWAWFLSGYIEKLPIRVILKQRIPSSNVVCYLDDELIMQLVNDEVHQQGEVIAKAQPITHDILHRVLVRHRDVVKTAKLFGLVVDDKLRFSDYHEFVFKGGKLVKVQPFDWRKRF